MTSLLRNQAKEELLEFIELSTDFKCCAKIKYSLKYKFYGCRIYLSIKNSNYRTLVSLLFKIRSQGDMNQFKTLLSSLLSMCHNIHACHVESESD